MPTDTLRPAVHDVEGPERDDEEREHRPDQGQTRRDQPTRQPEHDRLDRLDDLREERLEGVLGSAGNPTPTLARRSWNEFNQLDEEIRECGDERGKLADQWPRDEDREQDREQDRRREDNEDRHAPVQPAIRHRLDRRIDGDHVERPDHERPELG